MGSAVAVAEPARDPDRLLARAGVRGDPDRDQHFLVDDRVLDRIARYGAELPGQVETVLEIGAGTGALTDRLLHEGDHVIAIELDRHLIEFLKEEFAQELETGVLELLGGDALELDLPSFDAVVANLPYSAASQIIFRLLPHHTPMVVMVQHEFAERLTADSATPAYGRLTVSAWWYADATILEVVPSTAFDPAPPVESAVVRFDPAPDRPGIDEERFHDIVKAIFTQRRKTLRNAIRNTTHISGIADAQTVIESLDESKLKRRPDAISPEEYLDIVRRVLELEKAQ